MDILIISGLSGAGKSRVAAVLEDMDFYCVDNMPVALMNIFSELISGSRDRYERVALVADVRTLTHVDEMFTALDVLAAHNIGAKIIFIEAAVSTIVKRYKESRRRHPLAPDGMGIEDAVRREIDFLAPIRARADEIIDTTNLTLGNLQTRMVGIFPDENNSRRIGVNIKSFGYKSGIPIEADLVFDVRFLKNPFYVEALKDQTGNDTDVADYVMSDPLADEFCARLTDMLLFLLPEYVREGKRYLVVAIGCTGGQHRSVAIANYLEFKLREAGYACDVVHRDIIK